MTDITVIIRTIGRKTLDNAIQSALKEFTNVIVVYDGMPIQSKDGVECLATGQRFDKYGSAALNMGAYATKTPYLCLLDDDDEFVAGAGDYMREFVGTNQADIYIPGLLFNNGMKLCLEPGLAYGNVAVPTYKTEWFSKVPISPSLLKFIQVPEDAIDLAHVIACNQLGAKIRWYEKLLYLVRPKLKGTNGRGQ